MATAFTRAFLISEMKDMRASFGVEQLVVQPTEFLKCKPVLTCLQKYLNGDACHACCHLQALSCDIGLGHCVEPNAITTCTVS